MRDANFLKTCEGCYDPVFLLPLFNHLFEPGELNFVLSRKVFKEFGFVFLNAMFSEVG